MGNKCMQALERDEQRTFLWRSMGAARKRPILRVEGSGKDGSTISLRAIQEEVAKRSKRPGASKWSAFTFEDFALQPRPSEIARDSPATPHRTAGTEEKA